MMRARIATTMAVATSLALHGCGGEDVSPTVAAAPFTRSLADVRPVEWEALGHRRIFFGHQSVGRNILAGVGEVLERNPQIQLRVVQSDNPADVAGPAFIEANIGRNGDPDSKADAFGRAMDAGFGAQGGVAMYKYCYVDVLPSTDIDALFEDYVKRIEALKVQYPALTIVHFTLPLKRTRTGRREWMKRLLGTSTDVALNAKRNQYNERLLTKYGAIDPVFDLAALESTRGDGTRSSVRHRGRTVYTLAPEWTDDGAHLNHAAQARVAEQLLVLLATLEVGGEHASIMPAGPGNGRANGS